MAALAGPGICQNMSQKPKGSITSVETRKPPLPVKVSGRAGDNPIVCIPRELIAPASHLPIERRQKNVALKRLNCNEAMPYPPDGQARDWWQRLRNAFGNASSAFVQASLYQLIAAARLPKSLSTPAWP
jgi:hypothetical protein